MSEGSRVMIDPFSLCAVPITICFDDFILGQATGFFYEEGGHVFLVSNWHVFSGRDPSNGQPKDQSGFRIPNNLKFLYHPANNLGTVVQMTKPLTSREGASTWIQHKSHGQRIDVAATELIDFEALEKERKTEVKPLTINGAPQVNDMQIAIGSDIFVLGFPLGIMKTGVLPVWKRGSVATEIQIDVNDLPSFIIDTATREGMSGSPVIARATGGYARAGGGGVLSGGTFSQFLGVYSGRYVGKIDEAHLGIVWKAVVIEQIIDDPAPGDFETR